jgi:hypothetical protein
MSTMPSMSLSTPPTLAGGVDDGATAMVVVPMGHLSDPANTFYETFTATVAGPWALTTPPGVATNGGIVLATPTKGAVAVLPFYASKLTALSALVGGRAGGDGQVSAALAHGPSALAVDLSSGALATVSARGVVRVQASLTARQVSVTTLSALKAAPGLRACGVAAITAVAFDAQGRLALGLHCTKPGTTAVALQGVSAWSISKAPGLGAVSVLRLDPDGSGLLALVRSGGMRASLRALRITGSSVSSSRSVPVMDLVIRSTSVSAPSSSGRSEVVALAGSKAVSALVLDPGSATRFLGAALPLSTRAVVSISSAPLSGSGLVAFEVQGGAATIVSLTDSGAWSTSQVERVTIPYGSST